MPLEQADQLLVDLYNRLMLTPPNESENFDHQPEAIKFFIAVMELWQSVHMDGFILYFENCAESARYVLEALQSIGAHNSFQIVSEASTVIFPSGLPPTVGEIKSVAASIDITNLNSQTLDRLALLQTDFFMDSDKTTTLLYRFVTANNQIFDLPYETSSTDGGSK